MEALFINGCYVKPALINISNIKIGDVILYEGGLKTIDRSSLSRDRFMGVSIFGGSYHIKRKVIKCKIFNGVTFK